MLIKRWHHLATSKSVKSCVSHWGVGNAGNNCPSSICENNILVNMFSLWFEESIFGKFYVWNDKKNNKMSSIIGPVWWNFMASLIFFFFLDKGCNLSVYTQFVSCNHKCPKSISVTCFYWKWCINKCSYITKASLFLILLNILIWLWGCRCQAGKKISESIKARKQWKAVLWPQTIFK